MIRVKQRGNFDSTVKFLKKAQRISLEDILGKYGEIGVQALSSVTPVDTGLTASSWYYEIETNDKTSTISFCNSNIQNGIPIAIILQFGHGTGTGGWVEGRDYINPVIQPLFDQIANNAWKEVTQK